MNINNLFSGFLGFIIGVAMIFLFWNPVQDFIGEVTLLNATLGIFMNIVYVCFCLIIGLLVPIALSTTDDSGN